MTKFSIIAVDYENHVHRQGMVNGLKSLAEQSFQDFELIICHDGPKQISYEKEINFKELGLSPIIINTPQHMGNWGHSSRDMAMRQASGEFFIHFNIDNLLYPNCLEKINNKIEETNSKIIIFSIIHHKINALRRGYILNQCAEGWVAESWVPEDKTLFFTGIPPVYCNIDALQLVAHRKIWENNDYWNDYHEQSDSKIYERFCKENEYVHIPDILGENF